MYLFGGSKGERSPTYAVTEHRADHYTIEPLTLVVADRIELSKEGYESSGLPLAYTTIIFGAPTR